jgi:hypothetical protein
MVDRTQQCVCVFVCSACGAQPQQRTRDAPTAARMAEALGCAQALRSSVHSSAPQVRALCGSKTMQRCNNRTTAQLKPATVYVRLRQYNCGRAYHGVVRRAVSRRSVQCRSAAVDARLDAALRCAAITARGRHGVRVLLFAAMHGVRCMVYVAWCTLHGVHCTQVDAAHAAIGGGDVGARADGASASDSAQARRVAQGGSADR